MLNAGLSAVTDDWLKRWESLGARDDRLVRRLSAIDRRSIDVRATAALAQQTALALKREVERLSPRRCRFIRFSRSAGAVHG